MNSINESEDKLTYWKNLIEEKNKSGLALKEFCQGKNITLSQYYYYHGIIHPREEKSIKEVGQMKRIRLVNANEKESSVIRIILPNSVQCVLPRDISSLEIKRIVEVMMSC